MAVAVIAAFIVTASVVIALTMITQGIGISHAIAKVMRAHVPAMSRV
ncbi:MAG: hypothetical protein WBE34_11870 [Candidatus Nitrosopolaris sp.]